MFDYGNDLRKARYASDQYKELEGKNAWKDFIAQIKSIKTALESQLLTPGGTVDKWGKEHIEEKKAILMFINTLLAHTQGVYSRVDQLEAIKTQQEEQKAKAAYVPAGQIHGDDYIFDGDL